MCGIVMGNPHPTKSKPNKIGRKHVNGLRVWQKANIEKRKKIEKEKLISRLRKFSKKVKDYWGGISDSHPKFN